ncbi:MAG: DeoR family transcriptional regulator, partial [Selenomonas bovis]|nr:DeoR family transcriptional regulator [Selenomonas bovis]
MHIRQTKLLDIVNRKQKVSVTDLAEALNVSEVTIRKDLTALEQKGLL